MIMKPPYLCRPTESVQVILTPVTTKNLSTIVMADEGGTPSALEPKPRPQGAVRRDRSPPRNSEGMIICDHVNCRGKTETFRRVCEWNKHMDRHERPYKCREPGCELNPGFTYSGGLLRHQREVHKMHLSTKQPLFCPFPHCNRSSGTGFTRKENLEEHKRRRHLDEMSDMASRTAAPHSTPSMTPRSPPSSKKRKRESTPDEAVQGQKEEKEDVKDAAVNGSPDSDDQLVQILRAQLLQKDEIIKRQAADLQRLQNLLRSLPPQIYGVMPPRLPGGGVG